MDVAAPAKTETKVYATMTRGDHSVRVLIGGGTTRERWEGVKSIMAWNRWAAQDSRRLGLAFPSGWSAPRHWWQLKPHNWRAIFERGNV